MHLPDLADASSSKRLATPSSPLGAHSPSEGRRSETPTKARPAPQPNYNALAGPSREMELYIDIPPYEHLSSSLTQPASSSALPPRRAAQPEPHPRSDLDVFTSPVQSEDEEYDEDYVGEADADVIGKGKGRQRRGSGTAARVRGTPTGRASPRRTGGDTGTRDERGESASCFSCSNSR